jgi:hypothetical protein
MPHVRQQKCTSFPTTRIHGPISATISAPIDLPLRCVLPTLLRVGLNCSLFLFSAHRFFIIIDNRFRPAAIRWCFPGADAPFLEGLCVVTVARVVLSPSSAAIAWSRRFRSAFSSFRISWVSNVSSPNLHSAACCLTGLPGITGGFQPYRKKRSSKSGTM